jgi:hypothetical protein
MKKLNLLLFGIILSAFTLSSNAQADVNWVEFLDWDLKVDCNNDGVVDDILEGKQYCLVVHIYDPATDEITYFINRWRAKLVSKETGEEFSVNYVIRGDVDGSDVYSIQHYVAKGDDGSRYLVTQSTYRDINNWPPTILETKVKCR